MISSPYKDLMIVPISMNHQDLKTIAREIESKMLIYLNLLKDFKVNKTSRFTITLTLNNPILTKAQVVLVMYLTDKILQIHELFLNLMSSNLKNTLIMNSHTHITIKANCNPSIMTPRSTLNKMTIYK